MKTEVLIYAYLAICVAMIGFNIVCAFVFRVRDRRLNRYSRRFVMIVQQTIEDQTVTPEHMQFLFRKLKRTGNLMAFDKALEKLSAEQPEKTEQYLQQIMPLFVRLTGEYSRKETVRAAYYPYLIRKYRIFYRRPVDSVVETMLELVHSSSLYIRENALQAIYSMGSEDVVMKAMWILNDSGVYHHAKMITDGLLNFSGDVRSLDRQLWEAFDRFSLHMQRSILDYFRFSSPVHQQRILELLTAEKLHDELMFSCIRYFARHPYAPAYPHLRRHAENDLPARWEFAAVAASALASYPGEETVALLKKLLQSPNWHVRFNASQGLMNLGLDYTDLIDTFEGSDRFASEIMRYRFDQKRMMEKEAMGLDQ